MSFQTRIRLRALPALLPMDGRNIELQATDTYIQWRYVGDTVWLDLLPLSEITGPVGPGTELRSNGSFIQWSEAGSGIWNDLVAVSEITGPQGASATITIGDVETLPAGEEATVTNTGSGPNAIFNFGIPEGGQGVPGEGVPVGGTTGQVLTKNSNTNFDTEWTTLATVAFSGSYSDLSDKPGEVPAGGADGQVLAKASATDFDTEWIDPPTSMVPGELTEWLHRAALLDPAAYTYFTGLFDVTVPAGETWLVVNAWWCNFGSSTGLWFHRNLKVSEAFELPAGSQVKAAQASSFLWVCRPALVSGNAEYATPKELYFARLNALRSIVPSQLSVTVPAGSARGTVVSANFPTDFEDGMLSQVSTNDLTWTVLGLNDGAGGGNTLDEISDDHQMRLTGKMQVPFRRKLTPRIQGRGSSVSGNTTDVAIANGHDVLIYQKLPPTWRTLARSFYRESVLVDAPLLYYGMDEASGSTIASVGSSTTAANVISPVLFGAPGAPGDNGTGILLSSGDDGRIEIPGGAGLNFGAGDFTLEGWVKFKTVPNLASADPWIINAWQDDVATPNSFLLSVYSQKLRLFWRNSLATTVTVDSTVTLVAGKYYHFIAGRNGSNIFIRIVGAETRQTAAVTGTMATLGANKVPLGIGRSGGAYSFRLDGALDELAIYSAALSDARANAHHAASLGW